VAERLQKILSRAGLGSRRECEKLISEGRVKVNGAVALLGSKAEAGKDLIEVDGKRLSVPTEEFTYIAVYKPRFVLSHLESGMKKTSENFKRRKTVMDIIDLPLRLFPVGRLDLESEGLMLLTNDGELANQIAHPRYGHEKEYRVLVAVRPDEEQLEALRHGIVLEDGHRTAPVKVWVADTLGRGAWLHFVLTEGRKRQIREMCRQIGLPIVRLIRIRMGSLQLGRLKPGEWRYLTPQEVEALRAKRMPEKPRSRRKEAA